MSARKPIVLVSLALCLLAVLPAAAQAQFGFVPGKTVVLALSNGTPTTKAGSHPDSFTVGFELNQESSGHTEDGELRDAFFDLPPGFLGNPQAVKPCTRQQFEGATPGCPGASQIGVVRAIAFGLGEVINPIYLIEAQPGVVAQFGFSVFNWAPQQFASVLTDEGYGVRVATPNLPIEVSTLEATVWGTPGAESHDPERVCAEGSGPAIIGCSAGPPPHEPFLTMPTACGPFEATFRIDSKQEPKSNPNEYIAETVPLRDGGGNAVPITACEAVPFSPEKISATTTATAGESPSGLSFGLTQPNIGLTESGAITETEAEKMEVTLPAGVAVNPSAANGQGVCRLAQYQAAACPEDSKVGSLLVKTPLLDEAVEGSLYLAAPHENPFDSLIALYIIARAPARGVLVKQAGVVHADPATGQITSVFDDLPPVPYSSFDVRLREGPRAPLITPQLCGDYTTQIRLYPFSAPAAAVSKTAPLKVTTGAGGAGCALSEAQLPNNPTLQAGTTAPLAGAFSPLLFKLARQDGSQRFAGLETTLPKGLTAKLAGVPRCSEAQIAAATARSREGEGALEQASPSCPAASQIGIVNVGAGAGSSPYYAQGKAYLAGPYKGAPLSVAIITPAIAGPFDLGTVVVRAALYVDKSTAAVRAVSDPLPRILAGIPLDVRSVSLQLNHPDFVLNPTNCEEMAVIAQLTSTAGQVAALSNRFRVAGCANLGFKPKLALSLKGATKRTAHPALTGTYKPRKGDANLKGLVLRLPRSAFLDQGHIRTICTRVQYAANGGNGGGCPKASIYGKAKATTPLLEDPLEGPVYLRSSNHNLPDLVASLHGLVDIEAVARIDSKHGGIRASFTELPDAPITKVVVQMQGAKKGLIVNSTNLCANDHRANAQFEGHNGRGHEIRPVVEAQCGKKPHKRHHRRG